MFKSRFARPIPILVAIIGAYHIAMFWLHPRLPPVAKTEVVWGEMSDKEPAPLQNPAIDAAYCSGAIQSVSDNHMDTLTSKTNERVRFEYRPEASYIVNTGRAAEIVMEPGSTITIGNKAYALKEIEFQKADTSGRMDFYLIHRAEDGTVAVVAAPLQLAKEGNATIDALWRYMPQLRGEHNSLDDIHVDINHLLPHDRTYYRYAASGACNKDVTWLGLQSPVLITTAQMEKLNRALAFRNITKSL